MSIVAAECVSRLETCPQFQGTGERPSLVERGTFRCISCAGTGGIPVAGSGPFYFYRKIDWGGGYLTQRVAIVTPADYGRYRVTLYGPDGPHMHFHVKREEAFRDLLNYRMTDFARRILDTWPGTPMWERGMAAIDEIERWSSRPALQLQSAS